MTDVTLRVPEGYTWFFVDAPPGVTEDVDRVLDATFSYENPDAEYAAGAPRTIHLYKASEHGGPMGLMGRAAEALEAMGYDVDTEVRGDRSGGAAGIGWTSPLELRGYQDEAVNAVLDNGGGIVALPTGAGKTIACLKLLTLLGRSAIVFVHTKELLHQWAEEAREHTSAEVGVIGDGEWSEGDVTVATMQTLLSRGAHRLERDHGVMVFDECHRTSAADTFNEVGMAMEAEWRIGLSATPWRKVSGAEMRIEGAVGGVAYDATAAELVDAGYLSEPRFEFLDHAGPEADYGEEYHEAYARCVEGSDPRNRAIADRAASLVASGRTVLVNVNRIDQGEELAERINRMMGPDTAAFLSSSDRTPRREEVFDGLADADGTPEVLVSTLVKEGVDIPSIDAVMLAQAGRSDIQLIQVVGRALRPDGPFDDAVVADVRDSGHFFGDQFNERVAAMNDYYGRHGPGDVRGARTDSRPDRTLAGQDPDDNVVSLTEPFSDDEEEEMLDWVSGE